MDGQQRITSIGRFVTDKFAIKDENGMPQNFSGIAKDKRDKILQTKLLIYECEGTETEIKETDKTIEPFEDNTAKKNVQYFYFIVLKYKYDRASVPTDAVSAKWQ